MTTELIPISSHAIGDSSVPTVNARDLHAFLQSGQKFADWIKDRVDQYGFTQGLDFTVIPNFAKDETAFGGQRKSLDYHLTLDMGKELAMVERNAKGKEARQYFIECERRAKGQTVTDPTLAALVQSLVELDQVKQRQYDVEQRQHALAQRVTKVELQHRSGVPEGYRSKKHAHHLYGVGLSEDIFHLAMAHLGVASKSYIHTADGGYEVPSIAYKEDEITPAVEAFLDDAFQCTPQMCESPMLKGRRFRFYKECMAA